VDFRIPKFQGNLMIFADGAGHLVQDGLGNPQDIFSPDAEPGHAQEVAFVSFGFEFGNNFQVGHAYR
jgi:hypothetical protein